MRLRVRRVDPQRVGEICRSLAEPALLEAKLAQSLERGGSVHSGAQRGLEVRLGLGQSARPFEELAQTQVSWTPIGLELERGFILPDRLLIFSLARQSLCQAGMGRG